MSQPPSPQGPSSHDRPAPTPASYPAPPPRGGAEWASPNWQASQGQPSNWQQPDPWRAQPGPGQPWQPNQAQPQPWPSHEAAANWQPPGYAPAAQWSPTYAPAAPPNPGFAPAIYANPGAFPQAAPGDAPAAPVDPYRQAPAWKRHGGFPGSDQDDFMVSPDPSIGEIVSADTNRTRSGWHPLTPAQRTARFLLAFVGLVLGGLFGLFVGGTAADMLKGALDRSSADSFVGATALAFAALGGVLAYLTDWALRVPKATWVGRLGVQIYERGLFGPRQRLLRFAEAGELKVARVRHHTNGVYTSTRYDYSWRAPDGKKLLSIAGAYRDDSKPNAGDPVNFAFASESAWSRYRIGVIDATIAREGMARFTCGPEWIGVGKGFVVLGRGQESERLAATEIKQIYFERGTLVIKRKDAKEGFFWSQGVFRFSVAAMSDFQVFLVVLEEQTGIRFR